LISQYITSYSLSRIDFTYRVSNRTTQLIELSIYRFRMEWRRYKIQNKVAHLTRQEVYVHRSIQKQAA